LIVCLFAGDALAQFQGLGDLPGGSFQSFSTGVSADASTVVGSSDDGGDPGRSFIWTAGTGMQPLPADFDANAVDGSGAAVAGTGPALSLAGEGVRWTSEPEGTPTAATKPGSPGSCRLPSPRSGSAHRRSCSSA
jgi:hypothetical protein